MNKYAIIFIKESEKTSAFYGQKLRKGAENVYSLVNRRNNSCRSVRGVDCGTPDEKQARVLDERTPWNNRRRNRFWNCEPAEAQRELACHHTDWNWRHGNIDSTGAADYGKKVVMLKIRFRSQEIVRLR